MTEPDRRSFELAEIAKQKENISAQINKLRTYAENPESKLSAQAINTLARRVLYAASYANSARDPERVKEGARLLILQTGQIVGEEFPGWADHITDYTTAVQSSRPEAVAEIVRSMHIQINFLDFRPQNSEIYREMQRRQDHERRKAAQTPPPTKTIGDDKIRDWLLGREQQNR